MLLIKNAEIEASVPRAASGAPAGALPVDVRCRGGRIVEIGDALAPASGERVLDADRGALLPGLHDHHLHSFALGAALRSTPCGPPGVTAAGQLRAALQAAPGDGWVRGVGYHESVAGRLDRERLDALAPERPVRVQHRSGKMWFLNSAGLRAAGLDAGGDGRLFRADAALRGWDGPGADIAAASRLLASYGVTGVTDATPDNGPGTAAALRQHGLRQRLTLMGDESLRHGALKIMLDEPALPTFAALCARIERAHGADRAVAIHCVTRTELVFALAALAEAGAGRADRIEHASVADADALALVARVGVTVVTQPNFIAERGAQYLREVAPAAHPHLYRCRSFIDAGAPLGGGTDAPFGDPDPWRAMRAAVTRRTGDGRVLGHGEALSPERARDLFTTHPEDPGGPPRRVAVGAAADLCLLDCPWRQARAALSSDRVAATVIAGAVAFARGAEELPDPSSGPRRRSSG